MREVNMQQTNEALRIQLEEKERQRQREREERMREVKETQQRVEMHRMLEEQKEKERRVNQVQYRNVLGNQAVSGHELRMGAYKLSDIEKRLNRNMLDDRQAIVQGANEIINPRRNQSFDDDARKFYGGSEASTPNIGRPVYNPPEGRRKPSYDASEKITRLAPNAQAVADRAAGAPTQKHIWF